MYKHKLVQELYDLIADWTKSKSTNPILAAIWYGIRGELPKILQSLDENEEAVEAIRQRLAKVVGEEEDQLLALEPIVAIPEVKTSSPMEKPKLLRVKKKVKQDEEEEGQR